MYRFVDLTAAYWAGLSDDDEGPMCGIIDTTTDRFLEIDGAHVLGCRDDVYRAGGQRALDLVPAGFFGNVVPSEAPAFTCPECGSQHFGTIIHNDGRRQRGCHGTGCEYIEPLTPSE